MKMVYRVYTDEEGYVMESEDKGAALSEFYDRAEMSAQGAGNRVDFVRVEEGSSEVLKVYEPGKRYIVTYENLSDILDEVSEEDEEAYLVSHWIDEGEGERLHASKLVYDEDKARELAKAWTFHYADSAITSRGHYSKANFLITE